MSPSETQLLATTNLTLATFLVLEGFTPTLQRQRGQVKAGHPQGAWVFRETPTLLELVDAFHAGEATVEPDAFQKQLNTTRREMFDYLGIGRSR